MRSSVLALRKYAETYLVLEGVYDDVLGLIVLEYISESIPLAYHRKDSDEVHQLGNKCVVEHIRSGSEYCFVIECTKDHQRVHQGVAVVGSNNYSSIGGNILQTFDFNLPVAMLKIPIDDRLQNIVAEVFVVNVLSHFNRFLSPLLQRPFFR